MTVLIGVLDASFAYPFQFQLCMVIQRQGPCIHLLSTI